MQIKKNSTNTKENGIYYTPPILASYLVKALINKSNLTIFDPAYGEGALLLAAENTAKKQNLNIDLYGCDISPINGYLNHLSHNHLKKIDFFKYKTLKKYDIILMNPPFIKYHYLDKQNVHLYRKSIDESINIKMNSDFWVYFLMKALSHLKSGSSLGAILPLSFIQAEYSLNVRRYLLQKFGSIKILTITKNYFTKTDIKVVLLWLKEYDKENYEIKNAITKDINSKVTFNDLTKEEFESLNFNFANHFGASPIIKKYIDNHNFSRFGDFAKIRIGVVTGKDDYFILNKEQIKKNGLSKRNAIPILNNSKEFSGLHFNGYKPSNFVIKINKKEKFEKYINKGKQENVDLTAHSKSREPWYIVKIGKIPDAFFPYRISDIPFLALNDSNLQSTNSIHRVYFSNISENQIKWIQLSLLSIPGQLSLELYSKTYNGGLLKIEPSSLKNSIVYGCNKTISKKIYDEISFLLSEKRKEEAMIIATKYLSKKLNIPNELIIETKKMLKVIKMMRTFSVK